MTNQCSTEKTTIVRDVISHFEKRPQLERMLWKGVINVCYILAVLAGVGLSIGFYHASYDWAQTEFFQMKNGNH